MGKIILEKEDVTMMEEKNYLELKEKVKTEKDKSESFYNQFLESIDIIAGLDEEATGGDFYKAVKFMESIEMETEKTETLWKKIKNKFVK